MTKRRFELVEGTSSKFWEIEEAGTDLHIAWGKIGTAGQSQTKSFDDEAATRNAMAKLIKEKTGKGYAEVEGDTPVEKTAEKKRAEKTPAEKTAEKKQPDPQSEAPALPEADANALPDSPVPPRAPRQHAATRPALDAPRLYAQIRDVLTQLKLTDYPNLGAARRMFEAKELAAGFDRAVLPELDSGYYLEKKNLHVQITPWVYGLAFALGGARGAAEALVGRFRFLEQKGDFWPYDEAEFLPTLTESDAEAIRAEARALSATDPLRVRMAVALVFEDEALARELYPQLLTCDLPYWAVVVTSLLRDLTRLDELVKELGKKHANETARALGAHEVTARLGAASGRYYERRFAYLATKRTVNEIAQAGSPEAARFFAAHLDHKLVAKEAGRFFLAHPQWAQAALAPIAAGRTKAAGPAKALLLQLGLGERPAANVEVTRASADELPAWLRTPRWLTKKPAPKKSKAERPELASVSVPTTFEADWAERSSAVAPVYLEDGPAAPTVVLGKVEQLPLADAVKKRFGARAFWFAPVEHADRITLFDAIPEKGGSGAQADAIMEFLEEQVMASSEVLQSLVGDTPELEFAFHASAAWGDVAARFEEDGFSVVRLEAWPPSPGRRERRPVKRPEGDERFGAMLEAAYTSGWGPGTRIYRGGVTRIESLADGSSTHTYLGSLPQLLDAMSDDAVLAVLPKLPGGSCDETTARYLVARFAGGPHESAAIAGAVHLARTDALEALEADGVVSVHLALPLSRLLLGKRPAPYAKRWLLAHREHAVAGLLPAAFGAEAEAALAGLRLLVELDRPALLKLAARHGEAARARIEEALSRDPFDDVPSKLPTLPRFADPSLHPPLSLRASGHALPDEAVTSLLTMIAFSRDDAPYAGVRAARELLEPRSADAFAWSLFTAWEAGGRDGNDWVLRAVGALGGDECARKLTPKIRAWPGESAHAAAVKGLDALAAIGSDVSLMYLNGIAQKLKFKGLQEKARQKIDELAAERGLSAAELSDRLVPDLDLDAAGTRVLDFGPRQFRVVFDEALKPLLQTEDGKVLTDLPKPAKADDKEKAKEAAETWKALKADAKAIAQSEVLRLEQIMCAQRSIPADVFRTFFVDHPLVTHLARRLVWGVYEDGRLARCFRVAEDRTLTDAGDEAFALPQGGKVGLVHRLELDALDGGATAAKFGQLFSDYELLPPFDQLARATFAVTAAERSSSEVKRPPFKTKTGSVLSLEHRGWRKGPAQDAGWVWWMEKPLPGGLVAELPLDQGQQDGGICMGWMEGTPAEQEIVGVRLVSTKPGEAPTFGDLSAVLVSELLRDVELLRG